MKIAFVTGHYLPFAGGVETHVEQMARRLAQHGDDVTVLTQTDDRSWPRDEVIDWVRVRRFPVPVPSRHFAISPSLARALAAKRGDWDIVHAHGYHSIVPLLAALGGARPMVFTPHYHGTGHSAVRKLLHPPYRRLAGHVIGVSRRIICVSEVELLLFVSHFPQAYGKISVIPNGVDITTLMTATPFPTDKKTVISAGRLETYKHVDDTLRAFARLGDDYELIVTGDGPDRARLEGLARELTLAGRARFLGRIDVDELYRWYRAADVYVSMSSNEAMPVTVLECLASGARVVASDIPAHRALEERFGEALTIVPLGAHPDELATAIESATKAPPAHGHLVPTWDEVTAATRALYDEVLDGA
jgi:glycosyltransferase involved in cell wall biosynthesis